MIILLKDPIVGHRLACFFCLVASSGCFLDSILFSVCHRGIGFRQSSCYISAALRVTCTILCCTDTLIQISFNLENLHRAFCTLQMEVLLHAHQYLNINRDHCCTSDTVLLSPFRNMRMSKSVLSNECYNQLYIVMVHIQYCFTKAGYIIYISVCNFFFSSRGFHVHEHYKNTFVSFILVSVCQVCCLLLRVMVSTHISRWCGGLLGTSPIGEAANCCTLHRALAVPYT